MSIEMECLIRFSLEKEHLGNEKPVNRIKPLVSVCVTTYQHKNFIGQCLDGILMQQTDFPMEIIVGEDESVDGTRDICIEYAETYPERIRLFLRDRKTSQYYDQHGRLICRFNSRWNSMASRGKYIALCEGDDYWTDPLKLQKQVDFLEVNPQYVMSYHDARVMNEQGIITAESLVPDQYKKDNSSKEIIRCNTYIPTLSICFRNVIKDFPPERSRVLNGDNFLTSLLGQHGKGKYQENVNPAVYRKHSGGVWSLISETDKYIALITTNYWLHIYYNRIGSHDHAFAFYKKLAAMVRVLGLVDITCISPSNSDKAFKNKFINKVLRRFAYAKRFLSIRGN